MSTNPVFCTLHNKVTVQQNLNCYLIVPFRYFNLNREFDIVSNICYNLKFDTKLNGKPVKSRLPVFCLHVVYLPDLAQEKIFLIF